jgi:SAM-dependent MidA family methyltransferase
MHELLSLIRTEIERGGPIPFRRFMELALYHPVDGYYRRGRDPFGRAGDFYTAEQVQPVFGSLIAARIRQLHAEMGGPRDFAVVEPGAGRGEMAPAFSGWNYIPIDAGAGALPERFSGVVFVNEFFDALPVDAAVWRGGAWSELRVAWNGARFTWAEHGPCPEEVASYLARYIAPREEGGRAEANLGALRFIDRIASSLERGYLFLIDYGYTTRESIRFPAGTLMSYRRHTALDDVLADPGERDITSHVCFTAIEERAASHGFVTVHFETLGQTLLAAGEDSVAAALDAPTPEEAARRRGQLKTLLFGMGETFRTLILRKD